MHTKHKSVTFRENVSMVYPNFFDGSSSPAQITDTTATAHPSLELDPKYMTWLYEATIAHYPFIVNGTFAENIYRQNFDMHLNMKKNWHSDFVQERKAAVPALVEKYGSLGWGSLYAKVTEEAWVKNYRLCYRFDGSDEQLLEMIAEAYIEIKGTMVEEVEMDAYLTRGGSIHSSLSNRKWEAFTQVGGPLTSPKLGPGGVNLRYNDTAGIPFGEEDSALFSGRARKGSGARVRYQPR